MMRPGLASAVMNFENNSPINAREHFDPRSGEAKKNNEYPYYTAKAVNTIDSGPAWNSFEIGVFEHGSDEAEMQIGSY